MIVTAGERLIYKIRINYSVKVKSFYRGGSCAIMLNLTNNIFMHNISKPLI